MHHTFRLTCRAGCIKDKQHIFGIHLLGSTLFIALGFYFFNFIFPPYVAALYHGNRGAGAGKHNNALNRRTGHQRIINY